MSKKRIWTEDDVRNIVRLYSEDRLSIHYISKNI